MHTHTHTCMCIQSFGAETSIAGEVVFNTGMVGYVRSMFLCARSVFVCVLVCERGVYDAYEYLGASARGKVARGWHGRQDRVMRECGVRWA